MELLSSVRDKKINVPSFPCNVIDVVLWASNFWHADRTQGGKRGMRVEKAHRVQTQELGNGSYGASWPIFYTL